MHDRILNFAPNHELQTRKISPQISAGQYLISRFKYIQQQNMEGNITTSFGGILYNFLTPSDNLNLIFNLSVALMM